MGKSEKPKRKIALAIGGASGVVYGRRLLEKLHAISELENLHISCIISENAKINWKLEIGEFPESDIPVKTYDSKDFMAPMASGSAKYEALVICPCSMGMIGRIASGISNDLPTRAADVTLKEKRRLILVPRETPYNLIHLKNMTAITEAGGIICPASPSYYAGVESLEELIDTVVDRVIDLLGIEQETYRWGK